MRSVYAHEYCMWNCNLLVFRIWFLSSDKKKDSWQSYRRHKFLEKNSEIAREMSNPWPSFWAKRRWDVCFDLFCRYAMRMRENQLFYKRSRTIFEESIIHGKGQEMAWRCDIAWPRTSGWRLCLQTLRVNVAFSLCSFKHVFHWSIYF